ncbi:MAG: DNA cytosine methyltransferase [Sideroxydans sp.]|nr:DNA cytosine methyltransferase [Sideroxydans sp.]
MNQGNVSATINTFTDATAQFLQQQMQVRRLTPRECERLQGFPDDYTNIPGASDTTRYKALGNSMAVNVMQAIGQRIQMVSEIAK